MEPNLMTHEQFIDLLITDMKTLVKWASIEIGKLEVLKKGIKDDLQNKEEQIANLKAMMKANGIEFTDIDLQKGEVTGNGSIV